MSHSERLSISINSYINEIQKDNNENVNDKIGGH